MKLIRKNTSESEKVYGYARVSTQTQSEKGYGLETQKRAIRDYCKQNNLNLIELFVDDGVSGTQVNRDGLTDLLAALNGVNKVIVLNTSRLWRNDESRAIIQRELKNSNADVVSIEQKDYSIYSKDPNETLINGIIELLDNYERLSINLKLAKGRRTKARSGQKACGVAPIGYKWNYDGNTPTVELDHDNAKLVKLIYSKYLELESISKLKEFLDDSGYKTQYDNSFSKQALSDILKNDYYLGKVTHGSIKVDGEHEAIIDSKYFKLIQSKLKSNRRR